MSVVAIGTSVGGVVDETGANVKRRRTAMGMSVNSLAKRAGVDRGSLTTLEAGGSVRDTTVAAVERTLSELEHEMGMDVPSQVAEVAPEKPSVIRVEVQGVYGAKALVFEAPPENLAELEDMVDRVLRRLAGEQGEGARERLTGE